MMFMKKQLISLFLVFFVAQNNCVDNTFGRSALVSGASFWAASFPIGHGSLSPKKAMISGFSALAFDLVYRAARKFSPDIIENIRTKLGLNLAQQESLANLSAYASMIGLGIGLAGSVCWVAARSQNSLFNNIRNNNIQAIKQSLNAGIDINTASSQGNTALMIASTYDRTNIIQLLLNAGANVNATNNEGNTALMWAGSHRHTNVVQLLLSAGANVNAADNRGKTTLIEASFRGYTDIVQLLLNAGAIVNAADNEGNTALIQASARGHEHIVQLLLNAGAHVNVVNNTGRSALSEAYAGNRKNITELLIQRGAHGNSISGAETVLIRASIRGDTNIVHRLLDAGADVNAANNEGETALIIAIFNNNTDITHRLLSANPNVNTADNRGNTALIQASFRGQNDIIHQLLDAGANVNAINNEGKTALHYAINGYFTNSAYANLVRMLIEKGATIPSYIVNGTTILHRAYFLGDSQTFNLLLEHGADVNIPDREHGATLLHMACSCGNTHIVKLLLDRGVSVSAIDAYGKSPEDIAREFEHFDIADLLAEKGNIEKDCKVCFDSYPTRNFVRLHCGHGDTCKSCLLEVTNTNIKKRSIGQLACTAPLCQDKHFTAADLRSIIGHQNIALHKEYQEKINYLRTLEWIRTQASGKGCPSPDCQYAFLAAENPETIKCPECHAEYCSQCLHDHPNNWTCAQAKDVREAKNPDDVASARFLAEHTKPCPKCSTPTERNSGCNHMTCDAGSCESHFCFICGSTLESPYYRSAAVGGTLLCGCPTWPQSPASSS